mmetsp:Transcript_26334/g.40403  ORF Transcript_26334/g.40403 Transcript_26334/m.40403 type:complete len:264 (+) Transcript_26334:118-909(+)|eukprot:CAMPEP_0118707088 /NCGR_PEP_ID=MMETSP0800-20121206/20971_1 /TAXON_ID=210618 ORGANISM="Striatella unipunctata, Strain CCMP2910" /NCGR_SAMPLE_ID=MMETSP0800 /ASSEMBLY_ACC=CAM_ASM_000638 /LENGTH=263 /DNA_ID=CAMNT_0006609799 /DNA_START=85 /DNA_END=876 /DNA_ORIENTATION=+
MKFTAVAFLALVGCVAAGKPQLTVQVRDGKYDGLDGLDPAVTWSNSAKSGDIDLEYGIEASARPTTDLASLPKNVWGKASADVSGWGVSARAEVDAQARNNADIEVNAVNEENDVSVKMVANAGSDFSVQRVEATKGFDAGGARVTVNPRYNVGKEEADVVVHYNNDKTNVKLTASTDNQEVTVSQQIDGDNRVAPTLASNGDISVEWERKLGDDNSLTATLKPNDSLDLEWKDQAWTANINMPIDGTSVSGANVSIKREIKF